ncbi:MAG: adenylate/guanylate cyclase domain-containing protein, partial [Leptolyngbyaceae bacterium]|nr:adenylate/guanylate cyclase domain-containing protein [Leptolyngbyaceae bacterium]
GQVGKLLSPPHQDSRFAELFQDDSYPQQDYYTLIANSGKSLWMEPYRWHVVTMTTYLTPIRDRQNRLIGMTGIDVNISSISKAIDKAVLPGGGHFMVISPQGRILAYPPDPSRAEALDTCAVVPAVKEFWQQFKAHGHNFFQIQQNYWVSQKVQGTDWLMVAVVPRTLLLQPVLIITVGSALGAGIILAIVVFVFVQQLNRRLQPIVEKCQAIITQQQPHLSLPTSEALRFQGDEIQVLTESFHQMTQQLQEALEQTRAFNQALEKFVPKEFLGFLNRKNFVDLRLGDQVQQELSVLFSDIRNFTTMSEVMTPEESFQFINDYFSRMSPAIREHNGFIDKYIGDAIMALFSDKADDAIQAGLSILRRLQTFNQERQKQGLREIEIGIGINTGNLMIGTVGEANRMENTVISDTVNVAARVESLTKIYRVPLLITQQTHQKLSNPEAYAIRILEQVKVRGKSQPITIYEVFDADPPDLKQRKIATQPLFEQAIAHYQLYAFEKAESLFQECLIQNPQDRVLRTYIDRCQQKLFRFKVSALEQSFDFIKDEISEVSATFYETLFRNYPQVRPLFINTDIVVQQQKFARTLELMVENLRRPEAVAQVLRELGVKHIGYGVTAEYYPMIRDALLDTFALHMGDCWTPEVAEAWDDAYGLIQEMMLSDVPMQRSPLS